MKPMECSQSIGSDEAAINLISLYEMAFIRERTLERRSGDRDAKNVHPVPRNEDGRRHAGNKPDMVEDFNDE